MPMNPRLLVPRANFDSDAAAYIRAVEQADTQPLEAGVKRAIDNFVRGCKADGIWNALKASCILMGARTLSGALTPLVGGSPTNVNNNFVSGDYNRKTGLLGDGTSKYLDSNRNSNADPQDLYHQAVYVTVAPNLAGNYIGAGATATGSSQIGFALSNSQVVWRNRTSTSAAENSVGSSTGLIATSRAASGNYTSRVGGNNTTRTQASQTPHNGNVLVYGRNDASNVAGLFLNARMSFYSIGESLDLALLDTRVTNLYNAIGAAIP